MEEQILKIIERDITQIGWDQYGFLIYNGFQHKAKEITSHVMEFVDWIRSEPPVLVEKTQWTFLDQISWTTEKVYNYWLTEVKNKEK
jgi:hypothetical protein